MRYSDVLLEWYGIRFSASDRDLCDIHFSASSSHLTNFFSAADPLTKYFHLTKHRAHLHALQRVVSELGNFTTAFDRDGRGMDHAEAWRPERGMPDQEMFDGMPPDVSHSIGAAHWADCYLLLWGDEKASAA